MVDLERQRRFLGWNCARFQEIGAFKVLTFENQERWGHGIRFVFDERARSLTITGDYGNAVAVSRWDMTFQGFREWFAEKPERLYGAIVCTDQRIYEWDWKEIEGWFLENYTKGVEDERAGVLWKLQEDFTPEYGLGLNATEILDHEFQVPPDMARAIGKKKTGMVELWCMAFRMAWKQLMDAEKEAGKDGKRIAGLPGDDRAVEPGFPGDAGT